MARTWKRVLGVGVVAAAAYAVWRAWPRGQVEGAHWEPQPFPYPPELRADESPVVVAASVPTRWVESPDGTCPTSHPVKAKLASGIFHEPGGANYARTQADRCYVTSEAAEADGLRPAKR